MASDGTDQEMVTGKLLDYQRPAVSPDGSKIAFVSTETGSAQIYVTNADGSNLKQLTHTVGPDRWPGWPPKGNASPAWSPNGGKIAFVSWRNGNPDIYLMNRDGSNQNRLTHTEERDENPVWSPSGNYLLFQSNRNLEKDAEIFVMRRDGSAPRPLTNYTREDVLPVWIPPRQ